MSGWMFLLVPSHRVNVHSAVIHRGFVSTNSQLSQGVIYVQSLYHIYKGQHSEKWLLWHTLDPVVDRVERTDRLGCFVDRLDRLHWLVDDFTTRLDLAVLSIDLVDLRPCWSQVSARVCLLHGNWRKKILCPSTWCHPSSKWKAYVWPSVAFLLPPLNIFIVGSRDQKMRSMRPVPKLLWPLVEL